LLSLLHKVMGDAQRAVLRAAYKARSRAPQVTLDLSVDDDAVHAQAVPRCELDATKRVLAEVRAAMLAELSWRPPAPWRELLLSQWRRAATTLGAELDEAATMLRLRNQRFDIVVRVRSAGERPRLDSNSVRLETVVCIAAEGRSLLTAADEVSLAGAIELCRSGLVSDAAALSELVGEGTALACRRGGHDPYR
jgi:hypothetical protein